MTTFDPKDIMSRDSDATFDLPVAKRTRLSQRTDWKKETRLRDLNDDILWQVFGFMTAGALKVLSQADDCMKVTIEVYWKIGVEHLLIEYHQQNEHNPQKKLQTMYLCEPSERDSVSFWLAKCSNIRQLTTACIDYRHLKLVPNLECLTGIVHVLPADVLTALRRLTHLKCAELKVYGRMEPMQQLRSLSICSMTRRIAMLFPNLTRLSASSFTPAAVNRLAPKLQHLEVECRFWPRYNYDNCQTHFPSLKSLCVRNPITLRPSLRMWVLKIIARNNVQDFECDEYMFDENLIICLLKVNHIRVKIRTRKYFLKHVVKLFQFFKSVSLSFSASCACELKEFEDESVIVNLQKLKRLDIG